jgi:hypothetical protein
MDDGVKTALDHIRSTDRPAQNKAFSHILAITDSPVDWAYEAWDALVADFRHGDNHVRAIAAQVVCNLAKSDPERRILRDFDALFAVTKDERFVTARHCLQALWKVGVAGKPQQQRLITALTNRFHECASEKNCTLIRYDIIVCLRKIFDGQSDEQVRDTALALIETEADSKYRKKYASVWRAR